MSKEKDSKFHWESVGGRFADKEAYVNKETGLVMADVTRAS